MVRDLLDLDQAFELPAYGWKVDSKRRMMDLDNDPTIWSKPLADDSMLPSFELAEMLTALTLDEPREFQSAGTHLRQTRYAMTNVACANNHQTAASSCSRYELHAGDSLRELLVKPEQVLAKYQATMLPLLQSLFSQQMVQQLAPHSADTVEHQQRNLSAAQLRFLIFGAINNFAGVDKPDLKMMYTYLSTTIRRIADHTSKAVCLRAKLFNMPSAKPMAETFFRCTIEAGDEVAARSLLLWEEAGILANEQVCVIEGKRYTPVERAAELQHTRMTQTLIDFGADVNKTFCPVYTDSECRYRRGALEHALSFQQLGTDVNLVSIILQHEGNLRCSYMKRAFYAESPEIVQALLSSRIAELQHIWMEEGVLREAMYLCEETVLKDLIIQMCEVDINLNTPYKRKIYDDRDEGSESYAWEIRLYPPHLIDIAAQKGEMTILELLFHSGANMTEDSLPAAIRSENMDLVRFIIETGASINTFSSNYKSTPFADALRSQNRNLLQLLGSSGFSIENCGEHSLCAILAAAAEIGDIPLVMSLLPMFNSDEVLGWALCKAVFFDRTDIALVLLNAGAAVDQRQCVTVFGCQENSFLDSRLLKSKNYQATFALHNAIRNRNHILVQALLNHGASPIDKRYGATPLEMAVCANDREMIEVLIAAGAIVKHRKNVWTNANPGPLIARAVRRRYTDCARFLVEAGADINASFDEESRPKTWDTPLAEAIRNEDPDMIQWLLANGANPTHNQVLSAAITAPLDIQRILLKALSKIQPGDGSIIFSSGLVDVVRAEDVEMLQKLLRPRPKIFENRWPTTYTPLAAAVRVGNKNGREMVQMLLDSGMQVDDIVSWDYWSSKPEQRETAILVAIETKQISMVEFLLDHGASINRSAKLGIKRTPLQKAAEVGSYSIVQLLLNRHADVNAPPAVRNGGTALQLAAMQGFIGIVELLLEWHADPNMAGAIIRGRTAIQGAAEHGRFDMVKFLHNRCCIESQQYADASRLAKENGHNALSEMIQSFEAGLRRGCAPRRPELLQVEHIQTEDDQFEDIQVVDDQPEDQLGDDGAEDDGTEDDEFEVSQRTTCTSCNASISNLSALRRHERTVHGTQSHLRCSECSRMFRRRDNLRRHENTHRHPHQKLGFVVCPSCSKSYRKDYLPRHQRTCLPLFSMPEDGSCLKSTIAVQH